MAKPSTEAKKYDLKTLADVLEVVNEGNIDCFLVDFGQWLRLGLTMRVLNKFSDGAIRNKYPGVFRWIDDGETGLKGINIEIVDK